MLIPIALILAALILDFFVKTDREKINSAINQSTKAAVLNDVTLIDAVVSQEYQDQVHSSKKQLLSTCRSIFATYGIKKIRNRSKQITLSSQNASVNLHIVVHLEPRSTYAAAGTIVFVQLKINFIKTLSKQWLVRSADIISINNQPMNWNEIR